MQAISLSSFIIHYSPLTTHNLPENNRAQLFGQLNFHVL